MRARGGVGTKDDERMEEMGGGGGGSWLVLEVRVSSLCGSVPRQYLDSHLSRDLHDQTCLQCSAIQWLEKLPSEGNRDS